MRKISQKCAKNIHNMPKHMAKYAKNMQTKMHKICKKCKKYTQYEKYICTLSKKICNKYAKYDAKIRKKYAKCKKYAKKCKKYADVQYAKKYAKSMQKMSNMPTSVLHCSPVTTITPGLHYGLGNIQGSARVRFSLSAVVQSSSSIFGNLKINWR